MLEGLQSRWICSGDEEVEKAELQSQIVACSVAKRLGLVKAAWHLSMWCVEGMECTQLSRFRELRAA